MKRDSGMDNKNGTVVTGKNNIRDVYGWMVGWLNGWMGMIEKRHRKRSRIVFRFDASLVNSSFLFGCIKIESQIVLCFTFVCLFRNKISGNKTIFSFLQSFIFQFFQASLRPIKLREMFVYRMRKIKEQEWTLAWNGTAETFTPEHYFYWPFITHK